MCHIGHNTQSIHEMFARELSFGKTCFTMAGLVSNMPYRDTPIVNKTTLSAKPAEVKREWFVIDAEGKTLGNVATECAHRLRGKHKATYTPHVDTGDYMVVINAAKVVVTGNKAKNKMYHHHTGYIGNLKSTNFEKLQQTHPERIIELAVKGMLPKNPLGRAMYSKLRVFADANHTHQAQQPQPLELK